ncbi:MAG TPA: hypothetical protein VE548_05635 [Nitrososphaeraceae archaeon]|nr:hypothetical protein [Nitrososphaeraceae archaeon]
MVTKYPLVLLFVSITFSTVLSSNTNNFFIIQNVYAHIFTTDDTASFLSFVDQLQVESELVRTNLVNNNLSLAQKHANKAASLLSPSIIVEIAEKNQKVAEDLTTAVDDLQKITSSSDKQRQMVNQLASQINTTLGEAVTIRIEQEQEDSSNFLEKGIEFLRGIFGGDGEKADNRIDRNTTIQPLAFADLVDSLLINYGNAYAVDFDMTNMSNMAMMSGNSSSMVMSGMVNNSNSSMNMGSMNMSSTMNMDSNMNRNYSLVDMTDYQSAQALATKAQEIFNTELKPIAPGNASTFITNLENGLTQLNNSIKNKASPMDVMMIVHTQIHPNLLEAFNLELR